MGHGICPPWLGRILISPLRRWLEPAEELLSPYVREGMNVLEPGCAMGYFTLPLAGMVGDSGRVTALDVQPGMLEVLRDRARKAGLEGRIECRLVSGTGLGLEDRPGSFDFAAVLYVAHETPDVSRFFRDISAALKKNAGMLLVEPKFHVRNAEFETIVAAAQGNGFACTGERRKKERKVLFVKE